MRDEDRVADGAASREADELNALVLECVQRFELEGDAALEHVCGAHPEHATRLRARLRSLREMGLLGLGVETQVDAWPERLGDFRLLERLGSGGMGVVYLAEQISLGRRVALKLIRPEQLFFPNARARFQREVEAVAQLAHPGIVPVYTVGEERGVPYFAMEHVRGASLAELIATLHERRPESLHGRDLLLAAGGSIERPPPLFVGTWIEVCVRIAREVALALHHAHERGVLHRDVKPSNVMLTPDGRALLLDFGLASREGANSLTRTAAQQGSLPYMSPEQVDGKTEAFGPHTDVYALGVTLYEMLTLSSPFAAKTSEQLLRRITSGSSAPIRKLNPAVTADVAAVCATAMDLEPARRYPTALALANDLTNVLELRPIAARPTTLARQTRRWIQRHPGGAAALALLAAIVICGPLVFGIQQSRAAQRVRNQRDIATAQRERAEANLQDALAAVDTMLTRVGNERLADVPQMENVRRELLEDALRFYAKLYAREPADAAMRIARARAGIAMAQVLRLLGRSADAEDAYEAEIASLRSLIDEDPTRDDARFELARALNAYAGAALDKSDVPRALEAAKQAIALWAELGASSTVGRDARLSQATSEANIGTLLQDCGNLREAARHFENATRVAEQIFEQEPSRLDARETLARVLSKYSLFLRTNGDLEPACKSLERAVELQRSLAAEHSSDSEQQTALIEMSADLGALLSQLRRFADAEPMLRDASAAAARMVSNYPNTPNHLSVWGDARISLGLLLLRAERFDEAQFELEEALNIFQKVSDEHPDSLAHRGALGMALLNIGAPVARMGDFEAGRDYLERAIECFQQIVDSAPSRMNYRQSLGLARLSLAQGWVDQRDHATAARELAEATTLQVTDARYLWSLGGLWAKCAMLANGDTSVNADERARLSGAYAGKALDNLRAAADAGYVDSNKALDAPEFELVRGASGFAALRSKLGSGAKR